MNKHSATFSHLALAGVAAFVLIVLALHLLQPNYEPLNQLMSELALGPHGWAMFGAFAALALATGALAFALSQHKLPAIIPTLPGSAAACFLGAGIFRLGSATELHVGLIALAFMLCGLTMYLLPRAMKGCRLYSWGLGLGMAASTAQHILPPGLSQRLAALCLLIWICATAIHLHKKGLPQ